MDGKNIHFSAESDEWATPAETFADLDSEFNFTLDVAATPENAKCDRFYTQQDNGLAQSWVGERVWCNPPYSTVGEWIKKAVISKAEVAVLLIPARTDTRAWHKWVFPFAEIRFLKGRLKFGDSANSAPFPSAVCIFRREQML